MLAIQHTRIITPGEVIKDGIVVVDGGRIQSVGVRDPAQPDAEIVDATGLTLVPGFIDVQINGGFGHDFTHSPETIPEVARCLPQYGVTAFLPTIITAPPENVRQAQDMMGSILSTGWAGAIPIGLHLEGPFLNPLKKGAHDPAYLRPPSLVVAAEWSPETGVRLVTLAPELPGAVDMIAHLDGKGVVVSAGHSMADYDQMRAGIEAGIRYGTHLFNAMSPLTHREPGLIGALLDDERITVGLIADGEHVHPSMIRLIWNALGSERVTLVTDAMAALGMPPGNYDLGEFEVSSDGHTARLPDGTLAGSILSMDAALRNMIAFTRNDLQHILPSVTTTPARLLGLADRKGQIAPGFDADVVLLDPDMAVVRTFVAGQQVYRREN